MSFTIEKGVMKAPGLVQGGKKTLSYQYTVYMSVFADKELVAP